MVYAKRLGQALCLVAGLLWAVALVLLQQVDQQVTYTVCSGPLLNLPPGTIHWPPIGHHLGLITLQHNVTIGAVGAGIVGVFLLLYAAPAMPTLTRLGTLLLIIAGSLLGAALLWLAVNYHVLNAHLNALVQCL